VDALIPPSISASKKSGFSGTIKRLAGKVVKFYVRHKDVIDPVAAVVASVAPVVIKEILSGGSNNSKDDDDSDYATYSTPTDARERNTIDSTQNEATIERHSPSEHTVSPHQQRYGKDKVWKDKEPYTRGKNSDE
jgi:hypothetical protein